MVNLTVVTAIVYLVHGNVITGMTVLTVQMKLTVHLHHVKTRVYLTVAMASVSQLHLYVMDQVNSVTQAGVLTVLMAEMKA